MKDNQEIEYKISAVIPVYNRERTIRRCIDSVLRQTYPVYEIVIVDDGSIDQTLDILKEEYKDCIRLIRQEHKGAQAARNAGIKAACGEFIAFLDSDDEWLPNKLELQVQQLQKNRCAVIYGNSYVQTDWKKGIPAAYRKTGNRKQRPKIGSRKLFKLNGRSGFIYKWALKESFFDFNVLTTSKNNLKEIGYLDESVPSFQEWDTAIRLAEKFEFIFIKKPLSVYHLHDGETISQDRRRAVDGNEYILEKYKYEILSKIGKEELVKRYKELMKISWNYKDGRFLKYFLKYIMGKANMFIFEGN